MRFRVVIHPDPDGGFWATIPALPGCVSEADTRDELMRILPDAIQGWLEVAEEKACETAEEYGESLTLYIGEQSITSLAGSHRDDPFLQEICDEIYRQRDASRDELPKLKRPHSPTGATDAAFSMEGCAIARLHRVSKEINLSVHRDAAASIEKGIQ